MRARGTFLALSAGCVFVLGIHDEWSKEDVDRKQMGSTVPNPNPKA